MASFAFAGFAVGMNSAQKAIFAARKRSFLKENVLGLLTIFSLCNVHQTMKEMLIDLNNRSEQMMMGNGVVGRGDEEVGEVGHGSSRRQIYHWGGKIHNLPQDFEIPRMTLGALITCWYCGDRRDRMPPLRFVRAYDLPHKRNAGVLIAQWRKMMMHVQRAA